VGVGREYRVFEEDFIQKGERREAILQATLELIAKHGLQHTPMSLISKHARVSAGGIYHHFESKEELLQILSCRIKEEMNRALVTTDDPSQPLAKRFQVLWLSFFRYGLTHPQEMAFLEQYESVPKEKPQGTLLADEKPTFDELIERLLYTQEAHDELAGEVQMLYRLIEARKDLSGEMQALYRLIVDLCAQQLIKDLPLAILNDLTYGMALRLAKQVHAGQVRLDDALLTKVAKACWDAIAR
jgi:AcrR family transcriptional regulator